MAPDDARIAAQILALLSQRDAAASICPSEVARRLWPDAAWRNAMPEVRRVACGMAIDGVLVITQSETVLDPQAPLGGPIRLRRGARWCNGADGD